MAVHLTMATASSLGGCDFAANAALGWQHVNVFWRPEIAADVVSFVSSPANFNDGPTVSDLQRFSVVEQCAADGLHLLWDDGTQLWIVADGHKLQPLVAVLPFDESIARRSVAANHVQSRLVGARARLPAAMTRQAAALFALRLRALDGLRDGATRRQIAIGLFGQDRVPPGTAWKSSDVRSRTYRLIADAVGLSEGNYLKLLR